jgi:hypothetical protein
MDSSRGGTSWRTPFTRTSTPRSWNFRIGATRSMPLIMHADSAASSNSAGLKASGLPARSVSSVIAACLQCASLTCALRRTDTTSNSILAGVVAVMASA